MSYVLLNITTFITFNNKAIAFAEIEKAYKFKQRRMEQEAGHPTTPQNPTFKPASFSIDDYYKTFLSNLIRKEPVPPGNV